MRLIKLAGCMMSHKRPELLRPTLNTLKRQTIDIDWHFYQDGISNKFSGRKTAEEGEVQESIEILEELEIPNKTLHINEYNEHTLRLVDKMFDLLREDKYDGVIIFGNDQLMSKYLIELIHGIINQYGNIVTSMLHADFLGKEESRRNLNYLVASPIARMSGKCITKGVFDEVRDDWNDLIDRCGEIDWIGFNRPKPELIERFMILDEYAVATDGLLDQMLAKARIPILRPQVSRMYNTGREGTNASESFWYKTWASQGKFEYEESESIEEFEVVGVDSYYSEREIKERNNLGDKL